MTTPNGFNLESTQFVDNYLRTDGNIVNCQFKAGPWERWQFLPQAGGTSYLMESVQFPGTFLTVMAGKVGTVHAQAEATLFQLEVCDVSDTRRVALRAPSGDYVTITSGMDAPYGPGGGQVQLQPYSSKSVFILMPAYAGDQPEVVQVDVSEHPAMPSDLKASFLVGPDNLESASRCDVIKYNELTYWAYSYIDNRVGMAIVAYDAKGQQVKRWDMSGARYQWKITTDAQAKTVTFLGQASNSITMSWAQLADT
ncbi:hypothetical protein PVT67_03090 [Gallaecimonas kandeliae]|uniref:fascin domain-containing protein n=1 Tax=Gallaecimonas kandeliae TaxID=3029055 RepID=UPI002649F590|nr:hypothetical protein [Gallaecimonas kandeliae]WKE66249.1 hypothetical protein PVT67_03090 [Gallaecimonas kandeliae]